MARLAKDVLAEIPDQLLSFMKSRGIEPRPSLSSSPLPELHRHIWPWRSRHSSLPCPPLPPAYHTPLQLLSLWKSRMDRPATLTLPLPKLNRHTTQARRALIPASTTALHHLFAFLTRHIIQCYFHSLHDKKERLNHDRPLLPTDCKQTINSWLFGSMLLSFTRHFFRLWENVSTFVLALGTVDTPHIWQEIQKVLDTKVNWIEPLTESTAPDEQYASLYQVTIMHCSNRSLWGQVFYPLLLLLSTSQISLCVESCAKILK